jgi:Uma2 family endonuclease
LTCNPRLDDAIVVGMETRLTVAEYFLLPESLERMELVGGFIVREPAAPRYGHQSVVTRLTTLLDTHVRRHDLGTVCVSPVDVVLDTANALVVQPDIVFVARGRTHIIRDRIWGAPDLVVEVLSSRTVHRDRTTKLEWYGRYGVAECWLVEPAGCWIEVVRLHAGGERRLFSGADAARSSVLESWDVPTEYVFS